MYYTTVNSLDLQTNSFINRVQGTTEDKFSTFHHLFRRAMQKILAIFTVQGSWQRKFGDKILIRMDEGSRENSVLFSSNTKMRESSKSNKIL